ncbi:MAG: 16S rRNA (cytosine(1402)-N(4))-methyltransferase RsmH [Saprospiraceae bacterium]|jgi:16S rRNA (cytosine1402-N4)-methyltransferase|uniref:16S rRNA (cytosine(1402)-N(4))-methyltransferase RsmH n=1 Tax=Candidatus Brachybacter algidus TaxID=2982024 RepID=UPI001B76739F|nr:16S rRNA (cytosine(1402)-N(4))-methyltransferase RsmH [Candidatus Brachybacter algidus]MBP7304757.1 16S rRNA (cytosine(1402)-N(4))-methyltransferase RsmH [Saprospiraceae bacterium]MBK6449901.1 16S rRNA (cytosine(1402)-N(4))-methyltransferase RsmH [Candidatus Brachybacter algidus]MBK8356475.1 16S rRNA (cytosine(1402)-N(4))-methyltransferase RsmH [Candidatus Brachybacter algidus]MBK8747833.1 16S rRNA (cytosine(1402)-N(4))-methyltransferase RsmH [Candidatus Brachybacter algidus]MBK9023254.1 16
MDVYHLPVLLEETIEALNINPSGIYVDVTFGGGGHSRAILEKLDENGRIYVLDQDLEAVQNVSEDERMIFIHSNFRHLKRMLRVEGVTQVDGILADIGVSSHQFDKGERGFSFRFQGDLDMRMNQAQKLTAADVVMTYSEDELTDLFQNLGEVRNTKTLVKCICEGRLKMKIKTIEEFIHCIESVIKGNRAKYLAQVFQALRIEVNDELTALEEMLNDAYDILKENGTLAVISFHSLEDRIVKNFFKTGNVEGELEKDDYGNIYRPFTIITKKPIEASQAELKINSRARSAKLRVARKSEE